MNKVVREHYPVEKLPPDLRDAVPGRAHVRVTLDVSDEEIERSERTRDLASVLEEVAARPAMALTPEQNEAARARIARWTGIALDETMTTDAGVARVRTLRDEGED